MEIVRPPGEKMKRKRKVSESPSSSSKAKTNKKTSVVQAQPSATVKSTSTGYNFVDLVDSDDDEDFETNFRTTPRNKKVKVVEQAAPKKTKVENVINGSNSKPTSTSRLQKPGESSKHVIERMDTDVDDFVQNPESRVACQKSGSSGNITNGTTSGSLVSSSSTSMFKVPDLPRPKSSKAASSSTPSKSTEPDHSVSSTTGIRIGNSKVKVKNKLKEKRSTSDKLATLMRRTCVFAFVERLEDNNDVDAEDIEKLISTFQRWPNIFASKQFPRLRHANDLSSTDEIAEFAQWWFFGLAAMFLKSSSQVIKPHVSDLKHLIHTLCQRLEAGYPQLMENFTPLLLKILRDLTFLHYGYVESNTITISLTSYFLTPNEDAEGSSEQDTERPPEHKEHVFNIKITNSTEWAIFHFIEAVSIIFPRIYYSQHQYRHVFFDLLQRLLWRISPASVDVVKRCFTNSLMPNLWYLTEEKVSSLIREILESPTTPTIDPGMVRNMICQYDVMKMNFQNYSMEDCGLTLLKMGVSEFLYSEKFYKLLKNSNDIELFYHAFTPLLQYMRAGIPEDKVKLTRLISGMGLDVVLHPVLSHVLIHELKSKVLTNEIAENSQLVNVAAASSLWSTVLECWENYLNMEKYPTQPSTLEGIIAVPEVNSNVFESTMNLAKLAMRLKQDLKAEGVHVKLNFFKEKNVQSWTEIVIRRIKETERLDLHRLSKHKQFAAILETIECLDTCSFFSSDAPQLGKILSNLFPIPGFCWLETFHNQLDPNEHDYHKSFLSNTNLQVIANSPVITSKCVRVLRLDSFRPRKSFVLSVYSELMTSTSIFDNQSLVNELLLAISDISWVMKELSLKTIFSFLIKLLQSKLWISDSYIRTSLGNAILSLPCICCYNSSRSNSKTSQKSLCSSKSGCEICHKKETSDALVSLSDDYAKKIVMLASPILKSKFLLVKYTLSDLIIRCNNHQNNPSSAVVVPMVGIALRGKTSLCQEIFRKIGDILLEKDSKKLENVCPYRTDIAQKIFTIAMPSIATSLRKKQKEKNPMSERLPLVTRTKFLHGILALCSVGSMPLTVFIEIVKFLLCILADSILSENVLSIMCRKIISDFADKHQCRPQEIICRIRHDIAQQFVQIALKLLGTRTPHVLLSAGEGETSRVQGFIVQLKCIGSFHKNSNFVKHYYPCLLQQIVPHLHESKSYQLLLTAMAHQCGLSGDKSESEKIALMLQDQIMHYLPILLLDYGTETAKQCLTFMKKSYNFDAIFLARQEQRVLNEALARLDDRQEQVQRYLKHFCNSAEEDPLSQISSQVRLSQDSKILSRSEIQELLDKRALPFIINVESKMNSKYETIEFKQRTLRSFTRFIKLLGKSKMVEFRSKVYKTLISVAEQDCLFHEELFDSWKEYANTLDDKNFALMSSQILVALLRLREIPSLQARVDGLISHFVCFKKTLTSPHHAELYFLLDHCDDVSVRNTITETVVELKKQNWANYFSMLLKEAKHDNYYIRYQAFRKLRDVFMFDFELVEKHVLSKGEHSVSDVITTLLGGLRLGGTSEDDKIRLLIVDCFGLLGALDSSRFRKSTDEISSRKINMISCQIRDFCVRYLQELCREFQEAKDTTTFDYCACLIRIVLQVMNVKDSDDDELWKFLTTDQKNMILPILVREDYGRLKTDPDDKLPKVQCPIYLSSHGKTFESWLTNWISVLITCITKDQQQAYQIFSKSLNIIRKSIRISSFVAPYVATYAIFCAKRDQRKLIINEIKTVLERWTVLEERKAMNRAPIRDTETEIGLTDTEEMSVESEIIFHSRCTQVILTILEHLIRFHEFAERRWGMKNASSGSSSSRTPSQSLVPPMSMENMEAIKKVLDEIPNMLISQVAFDYQSYTTALFYFERELKCSQTRTKHSQDTLFQKNLDYLQRIYVSLNNLDDVIGISAVRDGDPSSHEHVLECLAKGEVDNSIRIIERMSANQRKNLTVYDALVQAYLSVEEPHKAQTVIRATLQENPEWEVALQEVQFSSLLQLQKWDELKTQVDQIEKLNGSGAMEEKISCWKIVIPRILSKLKQNQFNKAIDVVESMKLKIISPLVAASEEIYPYKRAYNYVVQLHILTEIEEVIKLLRKGMQANCSQKSLFQDVKRLIAKWEARIMNVCTSRKIVDQIMNVRKSVFEILKSSFSTNQSICDLLNSSIRECWLGMARDASKCGNFTLADNCLMKAKEFMSPKVLIEEAKILSRKGNKVKAISVLNRAIGEYFPESLRQEWKSQKSMSGECSPDRTLCAKALLLQVKLNEDLRQLSREEYKAKYKEPIEIHKESEKNFFTLGCYYGRLWNSAENKEACIDLQAAIVHSYSQSLLYGCKYVYQSLPELLSIWFDCSAKLNNLNSTELANFSPSNKSSPHDLLQNMNQSITRLLKGVPIYILMTAFSQLISRLCHPTSSTWELLKQIIVRIIVNHPYQALWKTMAVYKSVNGTRQRRCKEIYDSVRKSNPELKETIKDYTEITEKLLCLCEKQFPKETTKAHISVVSRDLPSVIKKVNKVLLPFQLYMLPTLPRKGFNHKDSDPFPETQIFIQGIEDTVDIMTSLQRPKKITLRATDGKQYSLLCKREDDLRKDSKVMEVNSVVNWYLKQNPESTQRRLYVRTYAVIPLNETCGLLEWVPNLIPYRIVMQSLYREKGLLKLHSDFRREIQSEMPLERKRALFEKHLAHTPPVFGKWFFNTFTDHQSWYAARLSYTRTTAVMSMVGYIMGLGDRHGENILLDTVTGEVVHVDYNCLFSKGEDYQVAERVPFRLTHNMVDAMGPLGVEGTFRKSCEVVMKMFRDHQSIFMSVLRPFVYDPFVEWDKDKNRTQNNRRNFNSNYRADSLATLESGERMNAKAVETMVYIQHRLDGTARTMRNVYDSELSVEAFVQYLINEATSADNLCQMYYGWIPSY